MAIRMTASIALLLGAFLVAVPGGASALSIFEEAGATAADIQDTVDAFRAALGSPNNLNAAGPLSSGRREINWDGGGGVQATTPAGTPFDAFLNTRGARFLTPGTGFVQAPPSADPLAFPPGGLSGVFNPTYGSTFTTFSPLRLFTPVGSNVTDALFFIPGTAGTQPASVTGFGAVFSDVDVPGATTISFFDIAGQLIGTLPVPAISGNATLSFLGITVGPGETPIGRVQIVTGNSPLGPDDTPVTDVVAMDDFLFAEPQQIAAPQPGALLLVTAGLLLIGALAGRTRGRTKP